MEKKWILVLCVALSVASLVGTIGFLTSGFREAEINVGKNEAPVVSMKDVVKYEGWQLQRNYAGDTDSDDPFGDPSAIRSLFSVDMTKIEAYEKQGYSVEIGAVCGIGKRADGEILNTPSTLSVKRDEDFGLISASGNATIYLAYSSDKDEPQGDNVVPAPSSLVTSGNADDLMCFVAKIEFAEGEDYNACTYVAAGFLRLTDSSGVVRTEYIPAREVLSVSPISLGGYGK